MKHLLLLIMLLYAMAASAQTKTPLQEKMDELKIEHKTQLQIEENYNVRRNFYVKRGMIRVLKGKKVVGDRILKKIRYYNNLLGYESNDYTIKIYERPDR